MTTSAPVPYHVGMFRSITSLVRRALDRRWDDHCYETEHFARSEEAEALLLDLIRSRDIIRDHHLAHAYLSRAYGLMAECGCPPRLWPGIFRDLRNPHRMARRLISMFEEDLRLHGEGR